MLESEYVICRTCRIPLSIFTPRSLAEPIRYEHPERIKADHFDHEPIPWTATPADAIGECDFCDAQPTVAAWVPGKRIVILVMGQENEYTSPWAACETCNKFVKNRSIHLLLDRSIARIMPKAEFDPTHGSTRAERQRMRREIKQLHRAFFKSNPIGPLPIDDAWRRRTRS